MATKSGQQEPEKAEVIEELLDALDSALDRVKVLYEQYFLGIQKQPPTYLHTDIERKIRDITQIQVRNTALRYRFATIQQKFGSYNAYWRRTLRQIENGTYARNLVKVSRQAARTGADVPEEILAAMPKRMRDQVKRDREAALAVAALREQHAAAAPAPGPADDELLTLADEDVELGELGPAVVVDPARREPARRDPRPVNGAVQIDEADADFDLDAFFSKVVDEAAADPAPEQAPVRWGASDRPARSAPSGLAGTAVPLPRTGDDSVTRPLPRSAGLPVHDDGPPVVRIHAGAAKPAPPPTQTPFTGVPQVHRPPAPPTANTIPRVARPPSPSGAIPPAPIRPSAPRLPPAIIPPSVAAAAATRPGMIASASPVPAAPRDATPSSGVPTAVMPPLAAPPRPPPPPKGSVLAPSQATRPSPIAPGASSKLPAISVQTMAGPFPRMPALGPEDDPHLRPTVAANPLPRPGTTPGAGPATPVLPGRIATKGAQTIAPLTKASPPVPRPPASPPPRPAPRPAAPPPPPPPPRAAPPQGVSEAEVSALYSKYVQAKQTIGEQAGPNAYDKLLKTIHAQAPKIMEQYKAKGVDFSVVVKDNQVVIRAKPKP
ncbi:MAG TPA: MXAN_5187 C-terminal domain-containing protein [Kofleriaceae bacterium]